MDLEEVIEEVKENNKYVSAGARRLLDEGVSAKKLSTAKWNLILRLLGGARLSIGKECGYCLELKRKGEKNCGNCPVSTEICKSTDEELSKIAELSKTLDEAWEEAREILEDIEAIKDE